MSLRPSGGAGPGGAQGHLSDPTTRGAAGGGGVKAGGRQTGGRVETTRRGQHIAPARSTGRDHFCEEAGLSGRSR